jgi:hypothetical protein
MGRFRFNLDIRKKQLGSQFSRGLNPISGLWKAIFRGGKAAAFLLRILNSNTYLHKVEKRVCRFPV